MELSTAQRGEHGSRGLTFDPIFEPGTPEYRRRMAAREGRFTVKRELLDRDQGQPNIEMQAHHVRNGLMPEESDPWAQWDLMVAKAITRVLLSQYRGHFWVVECNRAQGIAWISIPLLLGNWKHVFHLSEDITPAMIIRAGGQILERFNIPRSNLDVASFIAAKKFAVKGEAPPPS
jgi:hypothetical protein